MRGMSGVDQVGSLQMLRVGVHEEAQVSNPWDQAQMTMTKSEIESARQLRLIELGRCVRCMRPKNPKSKRYCIPCLKLARKKARERLGGGEWVKNGPGRTPLEKIKSPGSREKT